MEPTARCRRYENNVVPFRRSPALPNSKEIMPRASGEDGGVDGGVGVGGYCSPGMMHVSMI